MRIRTALTPVGVSFSASRSRLWLFRSAATGGKRVLDGGPLSRRPQVLHQPLGVPPPTPSQYCTRLHPSFFFVLVCSAPVALPQGRLFANSTRDSEGF